MGMVYADVVALDRIDREVQKAIRLIDIAKRTIEERYQEVEIDWHDRQYKELGDILYECNSALNNIQKVYYEADRFLKNIMRALSEYENVNLYAGGNSSESTSAQRNTIYQSLAQSIDTQVENLRNALMSRGIPLCSWLNQTLEGYRESMLAGDRLQIDVSFCNAVLADFCKYCLQATNPNYEKGPQWQDKCQRCVPALEMLRRGREVTVRPSTYGSRHLSYHPYDVWENPQVVRCNGSGMEDIQSFLNEAGDGARVQVVVYWDSPFGGGHTFIAEQRNGETIFSDPQTAEGDVSYYFDQVQAGNTTFCRIDNLQFSDYIEECYEEVQ